MDDFSRPLRVSLSLVAPKDDVVPIPPIVATVVLDIDAIDLSDFKESGLRISIESLETFASMLPSLRKLMVEAEDAGVDVDVQLIVE